MAVFCSLLLLVLLLLLLLLLLLRLRIVLTQQPSCFIILPPTGLFQVSTQFVSNFDLHWPTQFADLQFYFSFVNVDLPNMGCVINVNFVDKFLSAVITPLCLGAPFFVGFFVFGAMFKVRRVDKRDEDGHINPLLHTQNLCLKAIMYLLFLGASGGLWCFARCCCCCCCCCCCTLCSRRSRVALFCFLCLQQSTLQRAR